VKPPYKISLLLLN